MKDSKNIVPIVIAAVVALIITLVVRYFMPNTSTGGGGNTVVKPKHELSMPEIPLMVKKEVRKKKEFQVLIVSKDIKKDEKISQNSVGWKKWPEDVMQNNFIAKDDEGHQLNNVSDFGNAMKMWAKADIPNGTPLIVSMLTSEDPVKKAEEAKKKKKEEEAKKKKKEEEDHFIKKGMRAVTFPIDQKSASASHMLKAGDLIDILIMEPKGDKIITHKYKAIKILAIDGVTKFNNSRQENQEDSGLGSFGLSSMTSSFLAPKNITLEVKEDMVEIMLRQSERSGVILSIRNQHEKVEEDSTGQEESSKGSSKDNAAENAMVKSIFDAGKNSVSKILLEKDATQKKEKEKADLLLSSINKIDRPASAFEIQKEEERNLQKNILINSISGMSNESSRESMRKEQSNKDNVAMLINKMNFVGSSDTRKALADEEDKKTSLEELMYKMNSFGGASMSAGWKHKFGETGGKDEEDEEEKSVTVYRKLTSSSVQFDENGKITSTNGQSGSSRSSSLGS